MILLRFDRNMKASLWGYVSAFFGNSVDDASYRTIDYNLGNYLDPDYFRLKNLGHNIYIYRYRP